MNDKINFILPDFLCLSRSKLLFDIFDKYPFILRKNVNIYSFFGTFPCAIWNGGRNSVLEPPVSESFMKKVRDFYNKRGIKVTFTFTNYLIEEKDLHDEYCNKILRVFDNGFNEVLVANDILENYIRKNYPNYKINRSITAKKNSGLDMENKYNLIVINKDYNRNFEFMKKIQNKEKIEILCDEICVNNCPHAKAHYTEISAIQIKKYPENRHQYYSKCRFSEERMNKYNSIKNRNETSNYRITFKEIEEYYFKEGFRYFKLSGRDKFDLFGYYSIVKYLIKPKFQIDVLNYLFEQMIYECEIFSKALADRDPTFSEAIDNRKWKYV